MEHQIPAIQISYFFSYFNFAGFSCNCTLICISIQKHHWILVFMSRKVLLRLSIKFILLQNQYLPSSLVSISSHLTRHRENYLINFPITNNEIMNKKMHAFSWKGRKNIRNGVTFTNDNKIGSIYPFIGFIMVKVLYIRILHWWIRKVTLAFKLHFQETKGGNGQQINQLQC